MTASAIRAVADGTAVRMKVDTTDVGALRDVRRTDAPSVTARALVVPGLALFVHPARKDRKGLRVLKVRSALKVPLVPRALRVLRAQQEPRVKSAHRGLKVR